MVSATSTFHRVNWLLHNFAGAEHNQSLACMAPPCLVGRDRFSPNAALRGMGAGAHAKFAMGAVPLYWGVDNGLFFSSCQESCDPPFLGPRPGGVFSALPARHSFPKIFGPSRHSPKKNFAKLSVTFQMSAGAPGVGKNHQIAASLVSSCTSPPRMRRQATWAV